jgi:hypothetical protein
VYPTERKNKCPTPHHRRRPLLFFALQTRLFHSRDSRVSCTKTDMSVGRSERHEKPSLQQLSASTHPTSLAPRVTSTRKRKANPVLKDQAEASFGNATISDQPTQISAAKGKKRKLKNLPDEKPTTSPNSSLRNLNSTQPNTKTKSKGKSQAKDDTTLQKGQEKRLRRYRDRAPRSFLEKLHRAQTQRYAPRATSAYSPIAENSKG